MSTPSIRTTVVGSYPVPDWLVAHPTEQGLVDATRVVFQTQELAGIDVVADGELYRWDANHPDTNGMIEFFVRRMSGVRGEVSRAEAQQFAQQEGMGFRSEPAGIVDAPLGEGTMNLPRDFTRARGCTDRPLKFTLTGPHMLCKTLMDLHYGGCESLAEAIGRVLGAQVASIEPEVLQVDEANIPGHPEEAAWAAKAINLILDGGAKAKEKGVHVCFGNYGGQSIQSGTWEALLEYMNALHCDHFVLEFAFRGYDELQYFRDGLDPKFGIGLGVIDIKTNVVETPEDVARRIEKAVSIVGEGRIKWVHPDCGFWMLKRSVADRKIENLVKGRDLFLN